MSKFEPGQSVTVTHRVGVAGGPGDRFAGKTGIVQSCGTRQANVNVDGEVLSFALANLDAEGETPEGQPRYGVGQRVTINARPDAPGSVKRLDGRSGYVQYAGDEEAVVGLDGTNQRYTLDLADIVPEHPSPSAFFAQAKRDEYATKAEGCLDNAQHQDQQADSADRYAAANGFSEDRAQVMAKQYRAEASKSRLEAQVYATLAVAYGQETGR